jgi:hypothetical protein
MQNNIKHHWMRQRAKILPESVKLVLVGIALIALSDAEILYFHVFFVNFCIQTDQTRVGLFVKDISGITEAKYC